MAVLERLGIDASRASSEIKTGTEWYSRQIIRAIANLDERPVLRLYQREPERFVDNCDVEWVSIERRRFWTHAGLAAELRREPVDALFVPAHVIPWRHPPATVATIHDLGYRFEPGSHPLRRRLMLDATTRWNARRAQRIIVPSESTRSDLEREYGVEPARVDVIPHGLDHQRFRPLPREEVDRELERLGVRRPYMLFVSTIQPRKNLSRLVSAFEALREPDLSLVIAGNKGWMSDAVIARIEKSQCRHAIIQLGYVADESIPALYNGAAVTALPSLYEGFGMGVLEAMACGSPIVTSNVSSLPEVAGSAAVTVDPFSVRDIRDGLHQVMTRSTSNELVERGLRHVSKFTWERSARMTLDSIRQAYRDSRTGT